jgi:glycosyltransferase involved in cell wall biosynthesis
MSDKDVDLELTICLITKGRPEYLEPLLNSLSEALKTDWVKVIVVLNGASNDVSLKIQEWGANNSRIIIEKRIENDARQSIQWKSIKKHSPSWCTFISDDDIFNPEVLKDIKELWNSNPDCIAISSAAEVIDKYGIKTGELRLPFYEKDSSKARNVGLAFNKPGFPWPSLYLDIRKLPDNLPNSRYAFDWWVGIQLILLGPILCTDSPGIQYRVHASQESSVSSNRRKYFEALIWFRNILNSEYFQTWLANLSTEEMKEFWVSFNKPGPIYADEKFRPYLIYMLIECFEKIGSQQWTDLAKKELAILNGVLLRGSEFIHIDEVVHKKILDGNFLLKINNKACSLVKDLEDFFTGDAFSQEFRIGCRHSRNSEREITIDCARLKSLETDLRADLLVAMLTEYLEGTGYFDITLSPVEIGIIEKYRKLKGVIPEKFLSRVKKLLRKSLTS